MSVVRKQRRERERRVARSTRPVHEVLFPNEVYGSRSLSGFLGLMGLEFSLHQRILIGAIEKRMKERTS